MCKYSNISVEFIGRDAAADIDESTQTSPELERAVADVGDSGLGAPFRSPSTILGSSDSLTKQDDSRTVTLIDTDLSQRYPISLKEARDRALQATRRVRKQRLHLLDDCD